MLNFQEGFGAYNVRFPLFITENVEVPKRTPSLPGGGICRLSFGLAIHSWNRAFAGAFTGVWSTSFSCGKFVTWIMYMSQAKNSSFRSENEELSCPVGIVLRLWRS